MNRVLLNIRYKLSYQFNWMAWSLAIYATTMILLTFALTRFSLISQSDGSLVYRLWVLIITHFALTARFKEDFDFLLTLNSTRYDIYLSQLGVAFGFSAFISFFIIIERLIVDHLNDAYGFYQIRDPFHFVAPYAASNLFTQFVFFLIFCFCLSVFGLLMGSLFYRFGRKFTMVFWLVFSSIPVLVFPLFLWVLHLRGFLMEFITSLGKFLRYFDLTAASGNLLVLTIVLILTAWMNIRRLPQN